jgi:hypothetical protein
MRYMMMIKSKEDHDVQPPQELMDAMDKLNIEATEAGQMVDGGGLAPTAQGLRAQLRGGKITLTDGPFTEAKEVIGGYAIMDFNTREEMIESVKNFMDLHRQYWPEFEGEAEVRQIFTSREEYGWDTK